ncbi:MAG: dihydrofolate reductase [Bacilli bacterium]|nr:dihydrofolate reductase [Bacilli bacterium]
MISLIVAMAENRTIGLNGQIPWRIPGEQAYFKRVTMGHSIVMGRKTYESIGKPLPGRTNYILTRDRQFSADGCHVVHEIETILELSKTDEVFVIGGAEVYNFFFPYADKVYLTLVHAEFDGDAFFPELDDSWELIESQEGPSDVMTHTFNVYSK